MIKTIALGWEGVLQGNGGNLVIPVISPFNLIAWQIDTSMMFLKFETGWAEVLVNGMVCDSVNYTTDAAVHAQPSSSGIIPVIGAFSFEPKPSNPSLGGGAGQDGSTFMQCILKTQAPTCTHRMVQMSGLSLPVAAGQSIIFHMDHAGEAADVEMQGVLFYA